MNEIDQDSDGNRSEDYEFDTEFPDGEANPGINRLDYDDEDDDSVRDSTPEGPGGYGPGAPLSVNGETADETEPPQLDSITAYHRMDDDDAGERPAGASSSAASDIPAGPVYGPHPAGSSSVSSAAGAGSPPLQLGWWDSDDRDNHDLNDRRGHAGLAGLKNQGATCYLNSLVQVLYMTPEFRRMIYTIPCAIEAARLKQKRADKPQANGSLSEPTPVAQADGKDKEKDDGGGAGDKETAAAARPNGVVATGGKQDGAVDDKSNLKNDILFQMQVLFARMQYADVSSVSTSNLTTSFGWDNADVFVQHDVQELNRVLCDKLEEKMKLIGKEDGCTVGQLYKGVMLNMITCMNCNRISKREEDFYDVSLVIKGKKSIVDSLKEFCEVETMKDDNAYFCERCASKQTAEKCIRFKSMPAVLNLQLKRFEYDWENNQRVKLNDDIAFPQWLELNDFMVDPRLLVDTPPTDGAAAAPAASSDGGNAQFVPPPPGLLLGGGGSSSAPSSPALPRPDRPTPTPSPDITAELLQQHAAAAAAAEQPQQQLLEELGATSAALRIATASVKALDELEARHHTKSGRHQRKGSSSVRSADQQQQDGTGSTGRQQQAAGSSLSSSGDKRPKLDSKYELYGVLVHSGSAGFGHYYAFIKNFADGKWYKFNDEQVTPVDDDSVIRNGVWVGERTSSSSSSTSGGGGYGYSGGGYWSSSSHSSQRSATPYMLVYRRRFPRPAAEVASGGLDAGAELPQQKSRGAAAVVYDEVKSIDNAEIPPAIVDFLDQEKKRKEAKKKEREREMNSCTLEVFRNRVEWPEIVVKFDRLTTLREVLDKVVAQAEAETPPPPGTTNHYRFRRIAARKNATKRPMNFYKDSDYSKTLVQLGIDKQRNYLYLEQDTDSTFPGLSEELDEETVFITVRLFDLAQRRPTSVRDFVLPRTTTLGELKQLAAPFVGLDPADMVVVEEETDRQLNMMLVDDEPLSKYGIISGDIIHIEPRTPEHDKDRERQLQQPRNAWSLVRQYFDERYNELTVEIEESTACYKRRVAAAAPPKLEIEPQSTAAAGSAGGPAPGAAGSAAANGGTSNALPRNKFKIITNKTNTFRSLKESLSSLVGIEPRRLRVFVKDTTGYGDGRLIKDLDGKLGQVLTHRYAQRISTDLSFDILDQPEDLRKGDKLLNCRYHNANNEFVCSFEVKVNKKQTLREFKTQLRAKTGVPEELQVLSEWYNEHFYKLFPHLTDTFESARIRRNDLLRMDELRPDSPNISDLPADSPAVYAFQLVEFKDWEVQAYGRKEMLTSFPWLLTISETATLYDLRLEICRRTGAAPHNVNIATSTSFPILDQQISPYREYCTKYGPAAIAAATSAGQTLVFDSDREVEALCKAENRDGRCFDFKAERAVRLSQCRLRSLDVVCWEDLRTDKKKEKDNTRGRSQAAAAARKADASVLKIK